MDDVLRPNAIPTARARQQRLSSSSFKTEVTLTDDSEHDRLSLNPKPRLERKRTHSSNHQVMESSSGHLTRASAKEKGRINYDMKYHPIDDILSSRPKQSTWLPKRLILHPNQSSTPTKDKGFDNSFIKLTFVD